DLRCLACGWTKRGRSTYRGRFARSREACSPCSSALDDDGERRAARAAVHLAGGGVRAGWGLRGVNGEVESRSRAQVTLAAEVFPESEVRARGDPGTVDAVD